MLELELVVDPEVEVEVEFDLECGFEKDKFRLTSTLTSTVEKFADTALGTGGQRVISVSAVTGWNFAYERTVLALLGPECRIRSGLPTLSLELEE